MSQNKKLTTLKIVDKVCMIFSVALTVGLLWWSDWDLLFTGRLTAVNYLFMLALKSFLIAGYESVIEQAETKGDTSLS